MEEKQERKNNFEKSKVEKKKGERETCRAGDEDMKRKGAERRREKKEGIGGEREETGVT